jgi:hypothetical protein
MTRTDENQIESNLMRIYSILNSEIFEVKNIDHPLRSAAFIELSICLRDVAYKCEKYGNRISFDDDVIKTDKIQDITDLIKHCRDACCHIDSKNHRFQDVGGVFSFNTLYGKSSLGVATNPYENDICFFFGEQKIYLNRHIHRFLDIAVAWLKTKMTLLPREWQLIFEKRNVC